MSVLDLFWLQVFVSFEIQACIYVDFNVDFALIKGVRELLC